MNIKDSIYEDFNSINKITKMDYGDRFDFKILKFFGNKYKLDVEFEMRDNSLDITEIGTESYFKFGKRCVFANVWERLNDFVIHCLNKEIKYEK